MRAFPNSHALWARAERCLAGGPATLSKHPGRFPQGVSPLFLESASGCHVWDVDGQHYIDTVAALGPILLGHCDPAVTEAVVTQASLGTSLTLAHPLEVEVAEQLKPLLPWGDYTRVRFGKDGMAATNAAVRVARYVTGKQQVLISGYHGGTDWYMATTDKAGGILPVNAEYAHQVPFGDCQAFKDALDARRHDFAGMILEVPPRPWGEPLAVVADYLATVRAAVQQAGGLLILDEIVTGCRYPFAWQMYGCVPDLLCLGKGIANGYPLSVLAGPADVMHAFSGGQVFWSTTFGGETVSLAAARATLAQLADGAKHAALHKYGTAYGAGLTQAIADAQTHGRLPVTLLGNHARMILRWDDVPGGPDGATLKTYWVAEHIRRGVLYGGPIFPMTCWGASTVQALTSTAREVLREMASAVTDGTLASRLPCPPITDVFNTRYQETRQ